VKVLVVDDEALARERLVRLLTDLQPGGCCLQAASGLEALALAAQHAPDLVLLDIRMPGMDGIEVAAALDKLPQRPAIIFCTAYDEYALQALRTHAVAYLLKPVRQADLAEALAGAGRVNRLQLATLRAEESGPRFVSSLTHRGLVTLPISEVRCFLADQKYVTACSPEVELVLPESLKELEREHGDTFVRVHRSALVALAHIVRLQRDGSGTWKVELAGVEQSPAISRRHLAEVKQRLLQR
jgi:two-component system response regulator AlgR